MAEEEVQDYRYKSDEYTGSPFVFGLNAGAAFLTKFEWIPNGGKDGAEGEALDIIFNINKTEKSARMFPVTKAFDKAGNEVTDRNAKEFKEALDNFNAMVFHVVHCFVDEGTYKSALARPIKGFKDFCKIVQTLLPKNFSTIPLDIFLQYQWQISEGQNRTYLDVPKKMKYGKWVCAAMPGKWKEVRVEDPDDDERKALYYIDEADPIRQHVFTKNGWFMNSNFAIRQADTSANTTDSSANGGSAASTNGSGETKTGEPLPANAPPAAW